MSRSWQKAAVSRAAADAVARFILGVFVFSIARAMELTTILNHCHRHQGFVYEHARFTADTKSIEVIVRPRKGAKAVCSGCDKQAPGYDHLAERRFEFIPFWVFWCSSSTAGAVYSAATAA